MGYLKQNKAVLEELKDSDVYGQVKYISEYAKYPIYNNSEIKYFPLGELAFEAMLEELKKQVYEANMLLSLHRRRVHFQELICLVPYR